jgi:hypothetical protein
MTDHAFSFSHFFLFNLSPPTGIDWRAHTSSQLTKEKDKEVRERVSEGNVRGDRERNVGQALFLFILSLNLSPPKRSGWRTHASIVLTKENERSEHHAPDRTRARDWRMDAIHGGRFRPPCLRQSLKSTITSKSKSTKRRAGSP